jgi:hypothetical protein
MPRLGYDHTSVFIGNGSPVANEKFSGAPIGLKAVKSSGPEQGEILGGWSHFRNKR